MFHNINNISACASSNVNSVVKDEKLKNNSISDLKCVKNKAVNIDKYFDQYKLRKTLTLDLNKSPKVEMLGTGVAGEVWVDPKDQTLAIKSFARYPSVAKHECEMFNKFYGEGSAEIYTEKGITYMKMLRVPGKPLSKLTTDEIPENGKELLLKMISDLNDLNIIHSDLHAGNIMYDKKSNKFFPIDISNMYERYYSISPEEKGMINNSDIRYFNNICRQLEKNK